MSTPAETVTCLFDADCSCPVDPIGRFNDQSGLSAEISVVRCRRCGVGVTQPPCADIASLYADRASQDFQPQTRGLARMIKTIAFRRQAKSLLASAGPAPSQVIDYGCGSGLFTRCLADLLPPGARVTGIDFHPDPPPDLGAVAYRPHSQTDDLIGQADLLLAMHVIEHDNDPRALLNTLAAYVRPGGIMVIEVPNIDCIWGSIFGRFWDCWYLPYHRVHFNRDGLRRLAERAGLMVVGERDISVPSMGRTAAKLLGRRNTLPFILLSALLQPLQCGLERLTRKPSALRVVVRKL